MLDTGLKGKIAIITGANNPYGIGAGIAKAFANQGIRLFLHYFRPPIVGEVVPSLTDKPGELFYTAQSQKTADEVLTNLRELGAEAVAWEADLGVETAVSTLFDAAEKALGPVDIVVNNAAYWEADTFVPVKGSTRNKMVEMWTARPQTINAGSIDRIFAVNTRAVALIMAEFAHRQVQRNAEWGRIINISTAGAYVFPSEVTYGAGKLALEGYTRSAATELGQFGITVNTISPGPIQTGYITPEMEEQLLPTIPMGRLGTPKDIGDTAVFLASNQAQWITGQRLYVGGGHGM
ncbi:MAG: SDR family NAD(P)-dependent oxidoreductase [Chloroflexi bacterium]|nr:MAG: SDR family NAD(P)-dependent oxidoreductase [Chloroflexota bacterium]